MDNVNIYILGCFIVQEKYFRLLEFVVFQLNYVPCKELISLSLLLRNHAANYTQCSIQCMVVLLTILRYSILFYRSLRPLPHSPDLLIVAPHQPGWSTGSFLLSLGYYYSRLLGGIDIIHIGGIQTN